MSECCKKIKWAGRSSLGQACYCSAKPDTVANRANGPDWARKVVNGLDLARSVTVAVWTQPSLWLAEPATVADQSSPDRPFVHLYTKLRPTLNPKIMAERMKRPTQLTKWKVHRFSESKFKYILKVVQLDNVYKRNGALKHTKAHSHKKI